MGEPLVVKVEAQDDYGVTRFDIFKSLAPYRQHGVSVLQGKGPRQVWEAAYDTGAMGLHAGDTLELRAEVGDSNPFRFTLVSSPTTRLTLISQEEYAAFLRMELGYKEFLSVITCWLRLFQQLPVLCRQLLLTTL